MFNDILAKRRTVYALGKGLPISDEELIATVKKTTELIPDAFNMHSQRVVIALGDKQDALWDAAYDAFGGMVKKEKTDSFKAAHGTILFFIDKSVVESLQAQFELYKDNFPIWAQQSNGMLQIAVWSALSELGIGASLQHYNPVIDEKVKELFDLDDSYVLVGQMPFGKILAEPDAKASEDIDARVKVVR